MDPNARITDDRHGTATTERGSARKLTAAHIPAE